MEEGPNEGERQGDRGKVEDGEGAGEGEDDEEALEEGEQGDGEEGRDSGEYDEDDETGGDKPERELSPEEVVMRAVHDGDVVKLKAMLAEKPSLIDAVDDQGRGLLLVACSNGQRAVCKHILSIKAGREQLNKANLFGHRPLHFAAYRGHKKVVALLLADSRTDCTQSGKDGRTPLILAASHGHVGVIQVLLKANSSIINAVDKDGCTALWHAAKQGREEAVRLLKDWKADETIADASGCTPAAVAQEEGFPAIVEICLPPRKYGVAASLRRVEGTMVPYDPLQGQSAAIHINADVRRRLSETATTAINDDGMTRTHRRRSSNSSVASIDSVSTINSTMSTTARRKSSGTSGGSFRLPSGRGQTGASSKAVNTTTSTTTATELPPLTINTTTDTTTTSRTTTTTNDTTTTTSNTDHDKSARAGDLIQHQSPNTLLPVDAPAKVVADAATTTTSRTRKQSRGSLSGTGELRLTGGGRAGRSGSTGGNATTTTTTTTTTTSSMKKKASSGTILSSTAEMSTTTGRRRSSSTQADLKTTATITTNRP